MALGLLQIRAAFGRFQFRELGSGMVAPEPAWVAQAIVAVRLPFPLPTTRGTATRMRCHRLVAERLLAVLRELEAKGLRGLIRSYDGCYVPRHVCWDRARPLSTHAWGIALDLNAAAFPYGSRRRQDPRLVAVFEKHGFRCGHQGGGLWRTTVDPMHFEAVRT